MASYTIPEKITGIPLFVPSDFDFFQVENGGLPNGDKCLIVNGAVNRDYKAFQAAQTLSPNLFKVRNVADWSCSFWFKCAVATAVTSPSGFNNVLFSVQTRSGVASYSQLNTYVWNVVATDQGGVARIGVCASDVGGTAMTDLVRDGNWHLIVINVTNGSTGVIDCYTDGHVDPPTALSSAKGGTVSISEDLYFGLGAYGIHANSRGYDQQWRIGKLMFHNHKLTLAERIDLYESMTSTVWEYTDPFTRADSASVGGLFNETGGSSGHNIVSNHVENTANSRADFWFGRSLSNDHFVEIVYFAVGVQYINFRGNSSGGTEPTAYYRTQWTSAAGGTFETWKVLSGTATSINVTTGVGTVAAGDTVKAEVIGSAIKVYVNGVQKVSFTDASITTGGYVGFRSDTNAAKWDNFRGAPIT